MSFQTALSGLNASTSALDAIGNNVANSGTNGFKSAEAQFADVFAASLAGSGASQIGIGTTVASVTQQFTQGNITTTNNPLDIAINGQGFFRMSNNGQVTWTRNGQFQVNKNGFLGNSQGFHLTGYIANTNGLIVPSTPADIQINTADLPPVATGSATPSLGLQMGLNLDSRLTAPATATAGTITGSSLGGGGVTITAGANDTFNITVNGVPQVVTIPPSPAVVPATTPATFVPYSLTALASALQSAINSLYPSGAGVTVSVGTTNNLVFTAQQAGTGSDVQISAAGTNLGSTAIGAVAGLPGGNTAFATNNPLSYSSSTSATVYDSLGNPHILGMYFVKNATANTWDLYTNLDGGAGTSRSQLKFGSSGALVSVTPESATGTLSTTSSASIAPQIWALNNGATTPLSFNLDLTGSTQFGNIFGVNRITQDGYTSGRLSGLSVAADGTVQGRYTNGQTRNLAEIVLGKFNNPNGLLSVGGNQWQETSASGQPLVGVPSSGALGALQSAAIEESNVDLTAELVNMITAQRAYQANAQTIKTQDQILQTLVNLR